MGMFSWECKGCKHELKEGEYVRLNGSIGTYDGYGRAGGFEYSGSYEEPSAWHVRCYNNASVEDRLSDEPSEHAPNQGFGFAALENLKGYDPNAETKFIAVIYVIYVDHYDGEAEKTTKQQWYVVNGVLADEHHYEALYEAANGEGGITEEMWKSRPSKVEDHIGMKRPSSNSEYNESFEETKRIVESLIPSLPNPDWGYELAIFGKQGKIQGLCYQYNKTPGFEMVEILGELYPHNFVFNGQFDESVDYIWKVD